MSTPQSGAPEPDCNRCTGFFITHRRGLPYGCRPMAFRSARLPCQVVLEVTGIPCLRFEPKPSGKPPA